MEKEWKEGKKRKGEKKGDDRLEFRGGVCVIVFRG